MTEAWYSRRPEVAEMARKMTMADVDRFRRLAADIPVTVKEPGTLTPLGYILISVAEELEIRLSGGVVINLGPNEPCPDPTRCFDL